MPIRAYESRDLVQHGQVFGAWSEHYEQMSQGAFHGRVVHMQLDEIEVFEERMNIRVQQHFRGPQQSLAFCFDRSENALYVLDGDTQNTWVTPEHYAETGIVFSREFLQRAGGLDAEALEGLLLTPLRSPHCGLFVRWLDAMMSGFLRDEEAPNPALFARQLFDDCQFLTEHASTALDRTEQRRSAVNRRLVTRVFDFAAAYPDEHFNCAELARVAGVSVRQLQKSFIEHVGLPPSRWLRLRRLNSAYRELAHAEPQETTVAEVAMRWSFWHLGRFAESYRMLFGEYPSDTLGRPACSRARGADKQVGRFSRP